MPPAPPAIIQAPAERRPRRRRSARAMAGDGRSAVWNTYIWVESADETAAKVREAGGAVADRSRSTSSTRAGWRGSPIPRAPCSASGSRTSTAARRSSTSPEPQLQRSHTRDEEGAKAFYGAVFGWELLASRWRDVGASRRTATIWRRSSRGLRSGRASWAGRRLRGGRRGLQPDHRRRPHAALGRHVRGRRRRRDRRARGGARRRRSLVPPFDAPWIRGTVIRDPGAPCFTANQFKPENKDMATTGGRHVHGVIRARSAISVSRSTTASSGRPCPL